MRIKAVTCLILLAAAAAIAQTPPTPEQVKAAVAKGVAWLAAQQNPEGYWAGYWDTEAVAAMAILKLEHHAVDPKRGLGLPSPFDARNPYKVNVEKGLNWLLGRGRKIPIAAQPAGNPDTNGNGIGVYFAEPYYHATYTTSLALMAVCQAVELDRVVATGELAGRAYKQVAQDTMDYLAFGQNDGGSQRGGWGYSHNYGWGDNSNSGYATLALGYAEAAPPAGCGLAIPKFVKDELNIWIDYIQSDIHGDPNDGGSGYSAPDSWVNTLKTGNLLQQMALYGDSAATPRVKDALAYLARHWNDLNQDPGWKGSPGGPSNYQATFTIMKGLIALSIAKFGAPEIDWEADFDTALVSQQFWGGNWPYTSWDYGSIPVLSTVWALLTLQRAAPVAVLPVALDIKPTSCPNPLNVVARGVLPVAIAGTKDFKVAHIDPATVKLEGVEALRFSFEDVTTPYEPFLGKKKDRYECTTFGADGYLDLSLKFDLQAVVAALKPRVLDREVRILTITGNLKEEYGGKPIQGEDVIVILQN